MTFPANSHQVLKSHMHGAWSKTSPSGDTHSPVSRFLVGFRTMGECLFVSCLGDLYIHSLWRSITAGHILFQGANANGRIVNIWVCLESSPRMAVFLLVSPYNRDGVPKKGRATKATLSKITRTHIFWQYFDTHPRQSSYAKADFQSDRCSVGHYDICQSLANGSVLVLRTPL